MERITFDDEEPRVEDMLQSVPPININGACQQLQGPERSILCAIDLVSGLAHVTTQLQIPDFSAMRKGSIFPIVGVLTIRYVPQERCVTLGSLRAYVAAFSEFRTTEENSVRLFADDLAWRLDPYWLEVCGYFTGVDGIPVTPVASYQKLIPSETH